MDDVMKCFSCGEEMVFDHFTNSYVCTLCGRSEMRKSEKTSEEPSISMNKEESCRTVLPAEVQKKIDEYQKMPEEFMLSRIGGQLNADWTKIRTDYPKLPHFYEAIQIGDDPEKLDVGELTITKSPDLIGCCTMLRKTPSGEFFSKEFSNFGELERFLFHEVIEKYLDDFLKTKTIEDDPDLNKVIRTNIEYAMLRCVYLEDATDMIEENRTALSQTLTQITSGNKPFIHRNNDDGAFQYSHDSRDLDFRVRKEDGRFSVFYRSYRYDV